MFLVLLAQFSLLHAATCSDMQVVGELAFDLRVANNPSVKGPWVHVNWDPESQVAQELVFKIAPKRPNLIVAPQQECIYQYPTKTHVDALLSNMMNELTKVFVRANEFMRSLETRWKENGLKKASRKNFTTEVMFVNRGSDTPEQQLAERPVKKSRDKLTRFKVVHSKQKPFFDRIYSAMTDEYRNFYAAKFERIDRAGRDPCSQQPEVKQMWVELLQRARATLRSAAQRCVAGYLLHTPRNKKAQVRQRLSQVVEAELNKVPANQLNMLCDTYRLCYNDLLE